MTSASKTGKSMDVIPDGKLLVICDRKKVAVHDIRTRRLLAYHEHDGSIISSGFSPNGRELWVAHRKGLMVLKLTRQDSRLVLVADREAPAPEAAPVFDAILNPGGSSMIVKMGDVRGGGFIYEWRAESN